MTVRPQNYGDQYPSDNGDVPPGNPVEGFQERDYRVRGHRSTGIPVRPPVSGTPDMRAENEQPEPRPVWAGAIVSRIDDHKYVVLRQDGRRGVAFTRATDDVYDHLPPGEQVALIAAMEPNQWLIVGAPRRKEMASIRVVNSTPVLTNMAERQIMFDEIRNQTASDTQELALFGGGVIVKPAHAGQYEISLMVNVQFLDPASAGTTKLKTRTECIPTLPSPTPADLQPNVLAFDRGVGFEMSWVDDPHCKAVVTIKISESLYMPMSPTGGERMIWTDSPEAGNCFTVGAQTPQGWLHIRNNGSGFLSLAHGAGALALVFPDNAPPIGGSVFGQGNIYAGQHAYVSGIDEPFCHLSWTKPGVSGFIEPIYMGVSLGKWEFDKGILISGPNTTPVDNDKNFQRQNTPKKIWPCTRSSNV